MSWTDIVWIVVGFSLLASARACERVEIRGDCDDFGAVKLGSAVYECRKMEPHP